MSDVMIKKTRKLPSKKTDDVVVTPVYSNELVKCVISRDNVVIDRKKGKGKETFQPRWRAEVLQSRGYLEIKED